MLKHHAIAIAILFAMPMAPFSASHAATNAAGEITSSLNDQQSIAVTIYNNNLALVKDQRKVKLGSGIQKLAIGDVSAQIRPETALLKSLSQPDGVFTLEQKFEFDLLTPEKLLEKYVGKSVSIIKTHPTTGQETIERATVLSANNGVVLKIGNHIETGQFFVNEKLGRIVYDEIPDNLRDRPTLVTLVNNKVLTEQNIELSYLTGGLAWKADRGAHPP